MTPLIPSDRALIERSLDNELTSSEQQDFERRYATDESFRSEVEQYRRLKALLGARRPPDPDPAFWTRLSAEIRSRKEEDANLLPFPRRVLPLALGISAVFLAAVGFAVVQNSYPILRFWERQSTAVREAVSSGISRASLLPLFTGLDPDRALQFAFYGTLPLDEDKGTTLKVDERNRDGYRIEVQKEPPRKQRKVTVSEFMAEVRPTHEQRVAIDSLLLIARHELEGAVLVGANREVAINANLHQLNKTMVSGLAACLTQDQRGRLNRLLTEREAPYVVVAQGNANVQPSEVMARVRATLPHRDFVIVGPDSVEMTRMSVNVDELRMAMEQNRAMFTELAERRARMLQEWTLREAPEPVAVAGSENFPRIYVRTHRGRLTIDVNDSLPGRPVYFNIAVTPRVQVDVNGELPSVFDLEMNVPRARTTAVPQAPRRGINIVDTVARPRRPLPVDIRE